jgi:hypothetical protein
MYEDFEYDDDHDYDDSQNNAESQYKKYFKFDPGAWDAWGKFLYDSLNDIVEKSPNVWYVNFNSKSFPVNSYSPNTGKDKYFQYLGSNYQNQAIWKTKYFINDKMAIAYVNHIKSHAVNFILQPHYYKGMFDIMN